MSLPHVPLPKPAGRPGAPARSERGRRLVRWLAVLLAAGSLAAGGASERYESSIRASITRRHLDPGDFDVREMAAEAARRLRAGESKAAISSWISQELARAQFAFAPRDAVHDDSARYGLPYASAVWRLVIQGVGGTQSHRDRLNFHAWDFLMPVGTRIRAARAGTVAQVIDGFSGPSAEMDLSAQNTVFVLHEDGTFAIYAHLSRGIRVTEGQHVRRGQLLARSGVTGLAADPHLHFAVLRRSADGSTETVPIRFGRRGSPGYVPKLGGFYGARMQRPNVRIRVRRGEHVVADDERLRLAPGESVGLRAEVAGSDGAWRDVTESPSLTWATVHPWTLDVSADGRVTAGPARYFTAGAGTPEGTVALVYVDRARKERGYLEIGFAVEDGGPPSGARSGD